MDTWLYLCSLAFGPLLLALCSSHSCSDRFALRSSRLLDSGLAHRDITSMDNDPKTPPLYQDLDTAFVNLWSLLRNLTERGFIGRVRVELPDYSADVFMNGSGTPLVHEMDRAVGTDTMEEGALHRLVLRARETPGTITVFAGAHEARPATLRAVVDSEQTVVSIPEESANDDESTVVADREVRAAARHLDDYSGVPERPQFLTEDIYPTGAYKDWPAILATSGELIAAVERATNAAGEEFGNIFNRVRLQLADDYGFLDPMSRGFEYANGSVALKEEIAVSVFVSGLSEALRRCVDRVAVGERARRVRERMALELLPVARKHADVLERSGFRSQLDRIAGTRVV